tara:strand:+ start:53 stop:601 length:549 start_codon:yes stop_codon:yes gene_type:complete
MDNFDYKKYLAENKLNESQEGSIRNARYKGDTVILDTIIDGEEVKNLIFKDTGEILGEPESYDEPWVYEYKTEHNGKEYIIGVGFLGNPSTDLEFSDIMDDTIQVDENKIEEEYRGQMGSQTAQDLAVSKARFSNAILALSKKDIRTAEEVENEYIRVGMMMKNHLKFLFDDYKSHPSLDQI